VRVLAINQSIMSTPLNFKTKSNGGAYGTGGNTRQRRNPADYGPFSSPHGSFDDPVPFPPYAELPFTSLKRRRQFRDTNSFAKWVMQAVLLSPCVVLVLWSVAAVMFANNHHSNKNDNNTYSSSNKNSNNNNYSNGNRKQSQRNRRMLPNIFGNGQNAVPMASIPLPQQQLQDQQGNIIYNVNGNAMMMAPPQSQLQLQGMFNGQAITNNLLSTNGYQQQQQQQQGGTIPMQQQGKSIPVLAPLGNSLNSNIIPSNNLQLGQQQVFQQVLPQQAGAIAVAQPQQTFMSTNEADAVQTPGMAQQQQQQMPQVNLDSSAANVVEQPSMTESGGSEQLQQLPLDGLGLETNNIVQSSAAMQQLSGSSGATQDQLQDSPVKQAIYFYDPKDTKISKTGGILQMPTLVYDGNGKALPLAELYNHKAPIYIQAPALGATLTDTINSDIAGVGDADSSNTLVSPSVRGASLVSPSSREASIPMPQSWGTSTSQDQTIIIATVAVMALLVGALSARRLRSKSFLSSCIENESLEDDLAYDDAYTTTAAASGAMGADSSYNTFGGWKGDLEKFDV
jgi:hypothetical protein